MWRERERGGETDRQRQTDKNRQRYRQIQSDTVLFHFIVTCILMEK